MKNLTVGQLTLVDEDGRPKLRFSAHSGGPSMEMLQQNGTVALTMTIDTTGHPALFLHNPDGGSSASLAVDAKGAHIKFDRPGGASSYLFLNDEGVSGIVLVDEAGRRRYQLLLNTDGSVTTGPPDAPGSAGP